MPSVSSQGRKLEYIIFHTKEDEKSSFELGVRASYLPEEPKSPDESDTLDRLSYNLGLTVYRIEARVTEELRNIDRMLRIFVVYDQKALKSQLSELSKSIAGLKQIVSQHPISKDYLEKLIPRLEAQHQTLSSDLRKKSK